MCDESCFGICYVEAFELKRAAVAAVEIVSAAVAMDVKMLTVSADWTLLSH